MASNDPSRPNQATLFSLYLKVRTAHRNEDSPLYARRPDLCSLSTLRFSRHVDMWIRMAAPLTLVKAVPHGRLELGGHLNGRPLRLCERFGLSRCFLTARASAV